MYEMTATHFASLLAPDRMCSTCQHGEDSPECGRPFAISENGLPTRHDDPTAVTRWPKCPGSYMALRSYGQELVPLSQLVEWAVERGHHRDPRLSAGGERLTREWLRIKEAPAVLRTRREKWQREHGG